jgi:hypothetical protein
VNWETKKQSEKKLFIRAYTDIFFQLVGTDVQMLNTVLSVNCVFVSALHRLFGPAFFASILKQLFKNFKKIHEEKNGEQLKNNLNCFLHFYLFQSISA